MEPTTDSKNVVPFSLKNLAPGTVVLKSGDLVSFRLRRDLRNQTLEACDVSLAANPSLETEAPITGTIVFLRNDFGFIKDDAGKFERVYFPLANRVDKGWDPWFVLGKKSILRSPLIIARTMQSSG